MARHFQATRWLMVEPKGLNGWLSIAFIGPRTEKVLNTSLMVAIEISNRQRKHTVELSRVSDMAQRIAVHVCRNLSEKPCKWLSVTNVREIEARGSISLVLVSDRTIRQMNKQWRGKDKATDVLSFPLELEAPPPPLPFEIGEVIISIERARAQADEYGHTFDRELAFLMAHGFLHILGFDHETPADEKEMFGRQEKILVGAGFTRNQ